VGEGQRARGAGEPSAAAERVGFAAFVGALSCAYVLVCALGVALFLGSIAAAVWFDVEPDHLKLLWIAAGLLVLAPLVVSHVRRERRKASGTD
jgi:hypothetical protein